MIDRPKYEEPKLGNDLEYKVGEKVSTRKAYGNALVRLIKNGATHIFALDGDLSGSTCSS